MPTTTNLILCKMAFVSLSLSHFSFLATILCKYCQLSPPASVNNEVLKCEFMFALYVRWRKCHPRHHFQTTESCWLIFDYKQKLVGSSLSSETDIWSKFYNFVFKVSFINILVFFVYLKKKSVCKNGIIQRLYASVSKSIKWKSVWSVECGEQCDQQFYSKSEPRKSIASAQ